MPLFKHMFATAALLLSIATISAHSYAVTLIETSDFSGTAPSTGALVFLTPGTNTVTGSLSGECVGSTGNRDCSAPGSQLDNRDYLAFLIPAVHTPST